MRRPTRGQNGEYASVGDFNTSQGNVAQQENAQENTAQEGVAQHKSEDADIATRRLELDELGAACLGMALASIPAPMAEGIGKSPDGNDDGATHTEPEVTDPRGGNSDVFFINPRTSAKLFAVLSLLAISFLVLVHLLRTPIEETRRLSSPPHLGRARLELQAIPEKCTACLLHQDLKRCVDNTIFRIEAEQWKVDKLWAKTHAYLVRMKFAATTGNGSLLVQESQEVVREFAVRKRDEYEVLLERILGPDSCVNKTIKDTRATKGNARKQLALKVGKKEAYWPEEEISKWISQDNKCEPSLDQAAEAAHRAAKLALVQRNLEERVRAHIHGPVKGLEGGSDRESAEVELEEWVRSLLSILYDDNNNATSILDYWESM